MIQIKNGVNVVTIPYIGIKCEYSHQEGSNTSIVARSIFTKKEYVYSAVSSIDRCSNVAWFSFDSNMPNGEYTASIFINDKHFKTLFNVSI